MSKNNRVHPSTQLDELDAMLEATRPVKEVLAELTRKPLNLDQDPDFVSSRLKADIVEALLTAMQKRGMNQNDLAEKLKVTKQWVSRILNESDNFTVATLAKLACAVGMRPFISFADEGEVVRVMPCHAAPVKVENIKKKPIKRKNQSDFLRWNMKDR
jgi:transcriptional regulator with XRE-family HTH domain